MEKYRPSVLPIVVIYLLNCVITLVLLFLFFLLCTSEVGKTQISILLLIRHIFQGVFTSIL